MREIRPLRTYDPSDNREMTTVKDTSRAMTTTTRDSIVSDRCRSALRSSFNRCKHLDCIPARPCLPSDKILNDGEIMDQDELDQNQAVVSTDIIDHQVTFGV